MEKINKFFAVFFSIVIGLSSVSVFYLYFLLQNPESFLNVQYGGPGAVGIGMAMLIMFGLIAVLMVIAVITLIQFFLESKKIKTLLTVNLVVSVLAAFIAGILILFFP